MEYRRFGPTDMTVSALGFGCWEMGGTYGDVSQTELAAAVNRAIDLGINCFDTAPAYGRGESEVVLGNALGERRKDVIVVTKCGVGYADRPKDRDSRRVSIFASVEQSLQNLGTDYLDVLLIHWPDVNTPFDETMHALDSLVNQGKVRAVGVSNFTLDQIRECETIRSVDIAQYGLNMFDRRMEQEIFPYCLQRGTGVMVYGPLAFGLLTGTMSADTSFGGNDWRSNRRTAGLECRRVRRGALPAQPAGRGGPQDHRRGAGQEDAPLGVAVGAVQSRRQRRPRRHPHHSGGGGQRHRARMGSLWRRHGAD